MKKTIIIIFFAVLGLASITKAQAIIVRPPAPIMVRPVCPGPSYVWVNPYRHWNRRVNIYGWVNGYWRRPHHGWSGGRRFGYRF